MATYDVSALAAYTKDNADNLIYASMFEGKSVKMFKDKGNVMTGIKSAQNLEIIADDLGFQTESCGFTSSGTTVFSQRTLTVGKIKINKNFCERELDSKYTQMRLKQGSNAEGEVLNFEKEITSIYAGKIGEALERAIWTGDTTSGNANLSKFDGLDKIIKAATGVIDANVAAFISGAPITAATGITASNAIAVAQGIYKALPANVLGKEDVVSFWGYDKYRTLVIALQTANLFHFDTVNTQDGLVVPGTTLRIIPVHGLDNINSIYTLQLSNVYLGVDLENEEEQFDLFFAKEADEMRFIARFKMGVQIGFPAQIVKFVMA